MEVPAEDNVSLPHRSGHLVRDYGAVTADPPAPHAAMLLATLEAGAGFTHAVGLPDNTSAALFERLDRHPSIVLLTVTREGEAFAIASGLWVGGQSPIVIVQNTGLLESGDALRGTAARMEIPLLCLVTYRGYRSLLERGAESSPRAPGSLGDASLDSAALVTEPTLEAWGVPYEHYGSDADTAAVSRARQRALDGTRPAALLITRTLV